MKKLGFLSLFLIGAALSQAQSLVITEINYNPPDGPDTLEYLEIFNNTQDVIDLTNYSLVGVEFSFPPFNLESQEYVLVAKDSLAMLSAFGVTAFQWVSGGLNNSGELIALLNSAGIGVDSVDFSDGDGWPTTPDGNGPSLVLCNLTADNNNPANWQAANSPTGFVTNNIEILANPNGGSQCLAGPVIYFPTGNIEFAENGGSAMIKVVMANGDGTGASVTAGLNPASTALNGADFNFSSVQLTFAAQEVDTQTVVIPITDDLSPEGLETVVITLSAPSANASVDNARATFTLTITDNDSNIPNIVINEIMYNNPGADTYEFLELLNNDEAPVNLKGFNFTSGITYTFPDLTLAPGEYLVLAIDSVLFEQNLGVQALQFGGQLNNTGESVTLRDSLGNEVDLVTYSASAPWDADANGLGSSLELCDPDSDNELAASWKSSITGTGFFVNGIEVLASPGAANDCSEAPPVSYPAYPVGLVTSLDANGQTDSLGVTCQLQGVMYGVNLRPGGLQFTLIDGANEGIGVFEQTGDYGLSPVEGDQLIIRGKINQFNGLTQIDPDTVILVSSGNPLFAPTVITDLGENAESQLVKINNLTIVNPAQWTNSGSGFNVDVTNGSQTFAMRIDNDVNLFGTTPPSVPFNLVGLGGQFDSSSPYTEGYQIFPRYLGDIQLLNAVLDPDLADGLKIYPNPAGEILNIETIRQLDRIQVLNTLGERLIDQPVSGLALQLELKTLPAGAYIVKLIKDDRIWSRHIIKQ